MAILTPMKSDMKTFSKYLSSTLYHSSTCNVDIIAMNSPQERLRYSDAVFEIVSGESDSFIRGAAFVNAQNYDAIIIQLDLEQDMNDDGPEMTIFLDYLHVPSILALHGSTRFLTNQKRYILHSFVKKVAKIVAMSTFDVEDLVIGYGLPRDKVMAINHGYHLPFDAKSQFNAKTHLGIPRNKAVLVIVNWSVPRTVYVDTVRLDELNKDEYDNYIAAADTLVTYQYDILNEWDHLQDSEPSKNKKSVAYVPAHVLDATVASLVHDEVVLDMNVSKAYHCLIKATCHDIKQPLPSQTPLPPISSTDIVPILPSTSGTLSLLVDMGIKIHGRIAGGIRSLDIAISAGPGIPETLVVVRADSPVVYLTSDMIPDAVKIIKWQDGDVLKVTIVMDGRYSIGINATSVIVDMNVTPLSPHVSPRGLVGLLIRRSTENEADKRPIEEQIADFVVHDDRKKTADQVWKSMDVYHWPSLHASEVSPRPLRVALQGPYIDPEGVATVNQELGHQLISSEDFQFYPQQRRGSIASVDKTPLSAVLGKYTSDVVPDDGVDFWIRNYWPPDFSMPSQAKHLIMMLPWEFGVIPAEWVSSIEESVSEVWVPSQFVKQQFIDSGVPAEKVVAIGHGVSERFKHPDVEPLQLDSRCASKSFRFLYHGGLLPRKGIDILLRAYLKEFSAKDDVCLVIHTSYGTGFQQEVIDQLKLSSDVVVHHTDEYLNDKQIMSLYATCHVLVAPYRGEGYGLHIAEAMAMGLPVIVPERGPAREFVGVEHGWFIPSVAVNCDLDPCDHKSVFNMPTAKSKQPWWLAPDSKALGKLMRYAMSHPTEALSKGRAAREYVLRTQSWDIVGEIVRARLQRMA